MASAAAAARCLRAAITRGRPLCSAVASRGSGTPQRMPSTDSCPRHVYFDAAKIHVSIAPLLFVRRTFSTDGGGSKSKPPADAYVHPLSQIVLEHLQSSHSEFLIRSGLDAGLTLNQDGTFVLRFPPGGGSEDGDGRIWTSYESEEKKHWLTVHRGELVGRYLLQDNLKPAWHDNRSTPQKVQEAVDEMIRKLGEEGGK